MSLLSNKSVEMKKATIFFLSNFIRIRFIVLQPTRAFAAFYHRQSKVDIESKHCIPVSRLPRTRSNNYSPQGHDKSTSMKKKKKKKEDLIVHKP